MKIRGKRPVAGQHDGQGFSIAPGRVYDLPDALASRLIETGAAVDASEPEPAREGGVSNAPDRKVARRTSAVREEPETFVEPEDRPVEDEQDGAVDASSDDLDEFHVGGGWYELPGGERVRGKDAAREALSG